MRTITAAALTLATGPALAHPGHDMAPGTLAEVVHLLTAPDHVLLLAGVPLIVAGAVFLTLGTRAGGDDV